MSYLRFDKTFMTNLEESISREILRTNRSGAYHCTTIVECNTRKYHGLLVIPVPEIDNEHHVLLSSLEETVIQHGAEFELGLHQYWGNNFNPKGHKYIREFDCAKIPTTIYRVGGVLLKKEKIFEHNESRILIQYTLLEAHSPTKLRLMPFLAFRSVKQFTHENSEASRDYEIVENGIKTRMYPGYPELYMQLSKPAQFVFNPSWYYKFEYYKELERGYEGYEDLYEPGYFELDIKKGERVIFSAGISEVKTGGLKRLFTKESSLRTPRDNFYNCLKNSAHQFHNKQGKCHYILAGYPWFKCRARDMFISLPGLTLAIGENSEFESAISFAKEAVRNYINGKDVRCDIYELDHPDVLLWAIWSVQQYANMVSRERAWSLYGDFLVEIIDYLRHNRHENFFLHSNGLVHINGAKRAETWMNSTVDGRPVVPRTGYVVEINALWYNALMFISGIAGENGNKDLSLKLEKIASTAATWFVKVFLNEHGYLFDYVNGKQPDWSVRPNMIFAAALDYSPLDLKQKKKIVDIVTKELLTPKGLRSLSPKSLGYNPNYIGTQRMRDMAYHQGTAWPWLAGFYFEAYLKVFKSSGLSFVNRQMIGYEDEMTLHCISSLSELYDGNPPFKGRGAVSFAMNVAEILRALKIINEYEAE
ncbi:MAG TPA: glycogen debranching enzyme N-terminal domain-containing protein [Bacteroidaceae bacterium]|nr:glycogen debranching enzyme N-terminal domain-containing protein [Bacteroidaceae bacterium]